MTDDGTDARPVRVVVADDHPMFRFGLRAVLAGSGEVEVVGEATDGAELLDVVAACTPDVVITDLHMPGMDGVAATRALLDRWPDLAVLVVSMLDDDESVFSALREGARGYLLKGAGAAQIIATVQALARGETVFGPGVAQRVNGFFRTATTDYAGSVFPQLTTREREVLDLVAAGHGNATIGIALSLSEKTVRNHLSNLMVKLDVHDRSEAIVTARNAGLGRRPVGR
jgi:DNA-binding NarL/FixJ family response regulator